MPQPLVIRQAGPFERTALLVSVALGCLAVFTPVPITESLETSWPLVSHWLFGLMALGGAGGFWVTRGKKVQKSVESVRAESLAEVSALAIIGMTWGAYAITSLVTSTGVAVAAGGITIGVTIASVWRIGAIVTDLRKMRRALAPDDGPTSVTLEVIAETESGE